MTDMLKIVAFSLMVLAITSAIKQEKQDTALVLSFVTGLVVLLFIIGKFRLIIQFLNTLASETGIGVVYFDIMLKVLGIAYLTSFCSTLCGDAGESSLATKVEFAGKILILSLSIPIIMSIVNSILN